MPLGGIAQKEAVALGVPKSVCDQSSVETGLVKEQKSQDPAEGLSDSEHSVDVGFIEPFGRWLVCVLVPGLIHQFLPPCGVAGDAGDEFFGPDGNVSKAGAVPNFVDMAEVAVDCLGSVDVDIADGVGSDGLDGLAEFRRVAERFRVQGAV